MEWFRKMCQLCKREHFQDASRTAANFNCFSGLMGEHEMECACAVIVNRAREKGVKVDVLIIRREDFNPVTYDRDGFDDLLRNGWLLSRGEGYVIDPQLAQRIRSRIPSA